jgi:hypothetical protein
MNSVLSSQFSVLSSQFSVLSSQFSVLSSQFSVLSSQFSVLSSGRVVDICCGTYREMTLGILVFGIELAWVVFVVWGNVVDVVGIGCCPIITYCSTVATV